MKANQQKRATFEDVCAAQDKLIDMLDKCIEGNKPLSVKERRYFIQLFRVATLGLGSEMTFYIKGESKGYKIGHVGHAAYWLAYQGGPCVALGRDVFQIRDFWLKLRDYCFQIFSLSQEMSIKISKEQVRFGSSEAAMV